MEKDGGPTSEMDSRSLMWLAVADHLLQLQSFNALFAVMAGLGHPTIATQISDRSAPSMTVQLRNMASSADNFCNYRLERKRLAASGVSTSTVVPFFALEMQDLMKIHRPKTVIEPLPDEVLRKIVKQAVKILSD
eukprot:SAG31_NODE_28845_length_404_cov_1.052459_1_plen_134_part_11